MAILMKSFSYVPKGQFHPTVLNAGEKCPKEYEEIARKWGCFTPDADGAEAAKAELEAVKAELEAAKTAGKDGGKK